MKKNYKKMSINLSFISFFSFKAILDPGPSDLPGSLIYISKSFLIRNGERKIGKDLFSMKTLELEN